MAKRLVRRRRQEQPEPDEPLLRPTAPNKEATPLKPMNSAQANYMAAIGAHPLVFALGPAGAGKSYIAVATACDMLRKHKVDKLIITRPAVEAGENLGFLPGELDEKFAPYFAPVLQIMQERLGHGMTKYLIRAGKIVAQPLAYCRGLTFSDAFVILDEAQNTTPTQMKLLLTRLGEPVKCAVNGDLAQKDIPGPSGLADAIDRLQSLPGVGVVRFKRADIVRSGLCQDIVAAYENHNDTPMMD